MLLYILAALFPLVIGSFFNTKVTAGITEEGAQTKAYRRQRWWWLFLAALPMFALIAFRGPQMGADTGVYLKFFTKMTNTPWGEIFIANDRGYQFEEGFVVFEKLMTVITKSPQVYQVVYSSIYLLSVVTFANQLERHHFPFLYFFATMGIYTFMFTGVRQCLAMSICLLSYPFVKKRKLIPFLLLVLLAFTFHKSAILFLVTYFIYNRRLGWFNAAIYGAFAAIAFTYIEVIQEWFNDTLDYEYGIETDDAGFIFFAILVLATAFSYFMILHYKKQTKESVGMLNVGIITLILWLLRLATRVAERPGYYFMFFSAAMVCYALDAPKKSGDKLIYRLVVYGAFMLLFIYRFLTNFASLVPYTSFF